MLVSRHTNSSPLSLRWGRVVVLAGGCFGLDSLDLGCTESDSPSKVKGFEFPRLPPAAEGE